MDLIEHASEVTSLLGVLAELGDVSARRCKALRLPWRSGFAELNGQVSDCASKKFRPRCSV